MVPELVFKLDIDMLGRDLYSHCLLVCQRKVGMFAKFLASCFCGFPVHVPSEWISSQVCNWKFKYLRSGENEFISFITQGHISYPFWSSLAIESNG